MIDFEQIGSIGLQTDAGQQNDPNHTPCTQAPSRYTHSQYSPFVSALIKGFGHRGQQILHHGPSALIDLGHDLHARNELVLLAFGIQCLLVEGNDGLVDT